MSQDYSIFLISNACTDTYEGNTLSHFKNKLVAPISLSQEKNYEMCLQSIGFSGNFRNILMPNDIKGKKYPSIMITNAKKTTFKQCSSDRDIDRKCVLPVTFAFQEKEPNDLYNQYTPNNNTDEFPFGYSKWFTYYLSEKHYNIDDLNDKFLALNEETKYTNISIKNNKLHMRRKPGDGGYWVLFHESMMETLKLYGNIAKEEGDHPSNYIANIVFDSSKNTIILRKAIFEHELYYVFYIMSEIITDELDLSRKYPNIINVMCDEITPQIYNNEHQKTLVTFCPNFSEQPNYLYHEFQAKQYIPVHNSDISEISIELLDEKKQHLQLLEGSATILRIHIREMDPKKKSFNVRLTSEKNIEFPNNTNSSFQVKLPFPLHLDEDWKVSLTSISHPNVFTTFLDNTKSRTIQFYELTPSTEAVSTDIVETMDFKINENIFDNFSYSEEKLVSNLDSWLKSKDLGVAEMTSGKRLILRIKKDGVLYLPIDVAKMLGFSGLYDPTKLNIPFYFTSRDNKMQKDGDDYFSYKFSDQININYFKPNYIMLYANFITPTQIGGEYRKIMRIIPIINTEQKYTISEFKFKEQYKLQNSEMSILQLELRAHDGSYINFGSEKDIIVNLEFSNYVY